MLNFDFLRKIEVVSYIETKPTLLLFQRRRFEPWPHDSYRNVEGPESEFIVQMGALPDPHVSSSLVAERNSPKCAVFAGDTELT